jgi:hypothetical protein
MFVPGGLSSSKGQYHIFCFSGRGHNRLLVPRYPRGWVITKIKNIAGVGISCVNTVSIRSIRVSCKSQGTIPRLGESVSFGTLKVAKHLFDSSMVNRYGIS